MVPLGARQLARERSLRAHGDTAPGLHESLVDREGWRTQVEHRECVCREGKLDASRAPLHLHGRRLADISVCQAFWLISPGKEMSSEEYEADLHTGI